jgi:hypothetical protein
MLNHIANAMLHCRELAALVDGSRLFFQSPFLGLCTCQQGPNLRRQASALEPVLSFGNMPTMDTRSNDTQKVTRQNDTKALDIVTSHISCELLRLAVVDCEKLGGAGVRVASQEVHLQNSTYPASAVHLSPGMRGGMSWLCLYVVRKRYNKPVPGELSESCW